MQNTIIASQAAKNSNKAIILKHWKTNEELVCVSSYEVKCVEYFNKNKIDFDWQINFRMPNQKLYRVDAYLHKEDKYIEIKGIFRGRMENAIPISKLKWEWFHKTYPNSELWDFKKLKEIKIL
jgi:hypothetical protein